MQEQDAGLLVIEDGELGRLIAIELATVGLAVDVALSTAAARDCMRRRAYAAVLVDLRLCDAQRQCRLVAPAAGPTLHVIAPASLQKVETNRQATTSPRIIDAFETLLAPDAGSRANLGP